MSKTKLNFSEVRPFLTYREEQELAKAQELLQASTERVVKAKAELNGVKADVALLKDLKVFKVPGFETQAKKAEAAANETVVDMLNEQRKAVSAHNALVEYLSNKYANKINAPAESIADKLVLKNVKCEGKTITLISEGAFSINLETGLELAEKLARYLPALKANPKKKLVVQFKSV